MPHLREEMKVMNMEKINVRNFFEFFKEELMLISRGVGGGEASSK